MLRLLHTATRGRILRAGGWAATAVATLWAMTTLALGGLEAADIAAVGTAPAAVVGVAAFLTGRHDTTRALDLHAVADVLAQRIREQSESTDILAWNDTFPISIDWEQEPGQLTETMPMLQDIAARWPGGSITAQGPTVLDGQGHQLAQVLMEKVPTKRLVVLGGAGAGKTVLLIHMMESLLFQRSPGDPVPVRLPLHTWHIGRDTLAEWIATRLIQQEPTLAECAPTHEQGRSRAEALIRRRLVIPIFDGFDEVPAHARRDAVREINAFAWKNHPLVLASRPEAFTDAAHDSPDDELRIGAAAGVTLRPVTPDQAEKFLRRKNHEAWDGVAAALGNDTPVGRVLCTPLMLFLCRSVYGRASHETHLVPRTPDELCDTAMFPDEATIRNSLFNAFVPSVYASPPSEPPGRRAWDAKRAERHLRHLARRRGGDLSWWTLHHLSERTRSRLSWTTTTVVAVGLPALFLHRGVPLKLTAFAVFLSTLFTKAVPFQTPMLRQPAAGLRWRWRSIPALIGAVMGLALVASQDAVRLGGSTPPPGESHLAVPLHLYAVFSLVFGLVGGAAFGWEAREADPSRPVSPITLLRQDRRTFLALMTTWMLSVTTVFALLLFLILTYFIPLPEGTQPLDVMPQFAGVVAMASPVGLVIGACIGFQRTAWCLFCVARLRDAALGRLPLRLMAFLDDAYRRGVLRQAGASYEFRHIELELQLAGETGRGTPTPQSTHSPRALRC